ncbi:hypothetical protein CCHL11_10178 [Colletotrichum chlorophyti]|uniref:Rhodopsin domain-containing protein n=1 Tax=Colletotrichum chlorophyti TaxID=708187 RepID=A0A1Q8RD51_9PEZI|nr:hypothetical protein CCHL11_10178 [Colletotrichum chlorophyti]
MAAQEDSLLYHPDSAGHHIFNLNLALIIVSTILISLRLFVRKAIVKALGWDDLLATVAWGLCVTLSALEMDTTNYGTGAQMKDVPRPTLLEFFKRLSIMELVYFMASGAVRLSILIFLTRLSKHKMYRWTVYCLSLLVVVISLTGFFFVLTECSQIPDVFNYGGSWRQCRDKRDEYRMMLAHAIISIFVDCMLVALPIWVVSSYVKMGVKAIQILLVFSLGIFAVVTGIVRFYIITTTNFNENTTYKMLKCAAWTDAELHVGLWVGCLPSLQPLLRHASFALGLRSRLDTSVPSGKTTTTSATDSGIRKSVLDRWSRSWDNGWACIRGETPVSSQPLTNRNKELVEGQVGSARDVEMMDLEKGEGAGKVDEQRDILIEVNLGETVRGAEEQEGETSGQRHGN